MIESSNVGDLLKYEAPNGYSREEVDVVEELPLGTIVSQEKEKYTVVKEAENPRGIVLHSTKTKAVIIARHAVVAEHVVRWPENPAFKEAVKSQLELRGIIVRRSA